jgi:quaternary ammonium compound-resistance protein SugE
MKYWIVLLIAAVCEVMWAMTLKGLSNRANWSVWLFVVSGFLTVLNMVLLAYVMRGIPASTAYAVWTGLGAAGLTLVGLTVYHEPATALRIASLVAVIAGVIGLKLAHG